MNDSSEQSGCYIYVAYVTRKDGSRDYARDHGLKAFRIWVSNVKD